MSFKSRLPNQFPRDQNLSAESLSTLDAVLVQVNTLLGQGSVPPGIGVPAFGSNIIDPTGGQVITGGQRTGSVTTTISYTSTTTTITFYWDGTNGSQQLQIARDDGTTTGPLITGSPQTITGLSANTQYFFYLYWDETLNRVQFAQVAGTSVGSPAYAFTSQNVKAGQQQILKNRILLAPNYSAQGITTPSAGTGSGAGGAGGGSGGAQQTVTIPTSIALPSAGLRLQKGTVTGTGANQPFTFPVAFSGTPQVVIGNYTGSANIHTGSTSSTGFSLDFSSAGQQVDYIAIGPA